MNEIKRQTGEMLVKQKRIFGGLRKSSDTGSPEQHLIEMLCSSGFTLEDDWGFRAREPNKTVISSLVLTRLRKTDAQVPPAPPPPPPQPPKDGSTSGSPPLTHSKPRSQSSGVVRIPDEVLAEVQHMMEEENRLKSSHKPRTASSGSHLLPEQHSRERHPSSSSSTSVQHSDGATPEVEDAHSEELPSDFTTPHKLLLFWRKPARKCWWDNITLEDFPGQGGPLSVHIRRVWTLELSVIGVR
jgi:hypothetical protein